MNEQLSELLINCHIAAEIYPAVQGVTMSSRLVPYKLRDMPSHRYTEPKTTAGLFLPYISQTQESSTDVCVN